jgi:hypothetical protein
MQNFQMHVLALTATTPGLEAYQHYATADEVLCVLLPQLY